jgi:hypothetical protein
MITDYNGNYIHNKNHIEKDTAYRKLQHELLKVQTFIIYMYSVEPLNRGPVNQGIA